MMISSLPSLVVLISGSGSNLQAIIEAVENRQIRAQICTVISNRADAGGLKRAQQAGIKTMVIEHTQYPSRETFDQALIAAIDKCQPVLVILAGFMRILTSGFIQHYADRLLNIHPSLLPRYKGLHTHQRALENGDSHHGASVHIVSSELDSGPLVIQAIVDVKTGDTAQQLAARVLEQEHQIYPLAIAMLIDGRLKINHNSVYFNNRQLHKPLLWCAGKLREQD